MNRNNVILPEGQNLFTPSRNPYVVLPPFIKAWGITDLVFSGLWCVVAVLLIIAVILYPCFMLLGLPQCLFAALSGGIGLGAAVAMLSRKPGCVTLVRLKIIITMLHLVWHGFLVWGLWVFLSPHLSWQVTTLSVGGALFLIRVALLVFYWITEVKASRYFSNRRHLIGF